MIKINDLIKNLIDDNTTINQGNVLINLIVIRNEAERI